jgi:hypothetical protein
MLRLALCVAAVAACAHAAWKAGAAKVKIDPTEPIYLSGYGYRDRPSTQVIQSIWIKAASFQDDTGAISVITTSDLVGLDVPTVEEVSRRVKDRWGISRGRLLLNYSHNHSAPVTGEVLKLYYVLKPDEAEAVKRYTARLVDWYVELIGKAVESLAPARLESRPAALAKHMRRRHQRNLVHLGELEIGLAETRRHRLPVQFCKQRFGVERVEMVRTAMHEQKDDALALGREMLRLGCERIPPRGRCRIAAQQVRRRFR